MNESEIADLRKELGRLNQIITVLLKQNEILEKENSYLKSGNALSDFSISNPNNLTGNTAFGNSNEQIENRNSILEVANAKINIGNSEYRQYKSDFSLGKSGSGNSDLKQKLGNSEFEIANSKIKIGNSEPANQNSDSGIGSSEPDISKSKTMFGNSDSLKTIPLNITVDGSNIWRLAPKLRDIGFSTSSLSGIKNAATLLLHFYNKGRGDYPTLRKITGLTESGLAKTIISLKKRGLIHRSAYQQFSLSDSMQQMIAGMFAV